MEDLTPNQLVAYNLARIRREKGLTQEQAAELLVPYVGALWSKTVFSQAERSVTGTRVREFSADDLVAFSRAFEVPLAWFFMPPDPKSALASESDLLDLLFWSGAGWDAVWSRLGAFIQKTPKPRRTKLKAMAGAWIGRRFHELLELRMGPLDVLAGQLSDLSHALVEAGQGAASSAIEHEAGLPAPRPRKGGRRAR